MKGQEKTKKIHKLKIDEHFPFHIIGISCHENDYRLIWAINTGLQLSFVKASNLKVKVKQGKIVEFSRYFFEDEMLQYNYYIISNICPESILIPEYRTIDYFLFIKGSFSEGFIEEITRKLKKIEIISAVFIINVNSVKSIKRLMHLDE
jgi:hypothetical protein